MNSTSTTVEARRAAACLLGGVAATVLSRGIVVYAGLPSFLNYIHYPLIAAATMLLLGPQSSFASFRLWRAMAYLAISSTASWAWHGSQSFAAAALGWLILVEPLLIVACVLELTRQGWQPKHAERVAVGLFLIQVPFALFQFVGSGPGDAVQGLLVEQGAGAHVLGFSGIVIAIWKLGAVVAGTSSNRMRDLAILAIGFLIGVVTDTKQGLVIFVAVSLFVVLSPSVRREHGAQLRRAVAVLLLGVLVFAAFQLNASSEQVASVERRNTFVALKLGAVNDYLKDMRAEVGGIVLGLGPGRTASRISWLAPEDSTLQRLGVETSDTTVRLYRAWGEVDTSTAAAPFFSWLGIFGDLGLLGLAAYIGCWLPVWQLTGTSTSGRTAKAIIAFVLTLGFLFNWLEEPALTSVAALLLGRSCAESYFSRGRHSPVRASHVGEQPWLPS